MAGIRLYTLLTLLGATARDRIRQLRAGSDRGNVTTEQVMWIALTVLLVLGVYALFKTKIIDKITSLDLSTS
jgi:hypothetical protein